MKVSTAPVEEINFDWSNIKRSRIAVRLPHDFLKACVAAYEAGETYVDYWCDGGRVVGRLTPEGHVDYIINPEDHMTR